MPPKKAAAKKNNRQRVSSTAKRPSAALSPAAPAQKIMREKRLALWAGVIFCMTVIVTIWVFTLQKNVRSHVPANTGDSPAAGELLENFTRAFGEVREELGELQGVIGQTPSPPADGQTQIAELQQRLNEIEQRLELERFLYRFNSELQRQQAVAAPLP